MIEKEFAKKLRTQLRAQGFTSLQVETGGTTVGFPDIYFAGKGVTSFIEVKSRPHIALDKLAETELLGAGQAAFLQNYVKSSAIKLKNVTVFRHSFVIASCSNGAMLFRMMDTGALEPIQSWMEKEGGIEKYSLCWALESYYVSCIPNKSCKGLKRESVIDICAAAFLMQTGVDVTSSLPDRKHYQNEIIATVSDAYDTAKIINDAYLFSLMEKQEKREEAQGKIVSLENNAGYVIL